MFEKGKILVALIIILFLTTLGLSSYIIYDKFIMNETIEDKPNDNIEEEIEEVEIALDDERFINVYDSIKDYTYNTNRENGYNSFNAQELGQIGLYSFKENDFVKVEGNNYKFSGTTLIQYLKEFFGKNITLENSDLTNFRNSKNFTNIQVNGLGGLGVYNYISDTNTFECTFKVLNLTPYYRPRKIVSAKIINDEIIVEEKVVYLENGISQSVYKDPSYKHLIETTTLAIKDIKVDEYLDEASTITYTFKKDTTDNKYYFISSNIKSE